MRTDRRAVCLRCLYRQPAARTCALCGHEALADVADPAGRASVIERLEARGAQVRADLSDPALREGDRRFTGVAAQGAVVALGVTWLLFGGWAALGLGLLLGGLSVANMMWGAGGVARVVRYSEQPDLAYPEIGCVEARAPPRDFPGVVGRVRVVTPARGPVSGEPCAAARVKGSTAGGVVDDGVCGEFDLLDGDGAVVGRVREGAASVDVPTEAPRAIEALSRETQAFLQARMLLRSDGRATLAEARVAEGDVVRCEGPCETEPAPATYRESRAVPVYRGTAAHPVVIRRAEAPRPSR